MQQSGKPDSTFQKQAALTSQTHVSNPASIIQRARINPKSLTAADVLQLQRTIGNRAVGRLLSEIRNTSKVQQAPIQRQEVPEEEKEPLQGMFGKKPEEETCPSCVQRQEKPEEEEPLQGKFETIQRLEPEDEEKLQMKSVVQRQEIPEEEETLQGKMADPVQRQEIPEEEEPIQGKMIGTIQRQEIPEEESIQTKRENNTGMPDNLKAGVESLSGIDMSDVRVHYNSSEPAKVGALAYTQGTNIHVAPGQERHLSHEAWHVVQQKQGRVKPTVQIKKGIIINDDSNLEHEANMMGDKVKRISFVEAEQALNLFNTSSFDQMSIHAPIHDNLGESVQSPLQRLTLPQKIVEHQHDLQELTNEITAMAPAGTAMSTQIIGTDVWAKETKVAAYRKYAEFYSLKNHLLAGENPRFGVNVVTEPDVIGADPTTGTRINIEVKAVNGGWERIEANVLDALSQLVYKRNNPRVYKIGIIDLFITQECIDNLNTNLGAYPDWQTYVSTEAARWDDFGQTRKNVYLNLRIYDQNRNLIYHNP
jgi:hypothetical protein